MSHIPQDQFSEDSSAPSDAEIQLQALNITKDKLLSIVGHDLRSAIGGVISLAEMLDKRLIAGDLEESKRLNGLVRRASRDADDLLRDLVTWTRSHGQDIQFRLESLDVVELIETEVERLHSMLMGKNQTVRIDARDTGVVRADRYMLQAVIRNLLSNALKFSHPGGEIVVRTHRQPGQWEFQVCDKGIGMTPEVQDRILKIDQRKQKSGTSGEMGSGFGLLLCEDFIERHGGRLYWESVPGQGSDFCFTVPELLG